MPVQYRLEKVSLCVLFGLLCVWSTYRVTHHVFESFIGYTYLHKITVERILYSAFARTTDNTAHERRILRTDTDPSEARGQEKASAGPFGSTLRSDKIVSIFSDKILRGIIIFA
jgi:hypothetical protein